MPQVIWRRVAITLLGITIHVVSFYVWLSIEIGPGNSGDGVGANLYHGRCWFHHYPRGPDGLEIEVGPGSSKPNGPYFHRYFGDYSINFIGFAFLRRQGVTALAVPLWPFIVLSAFSGISRWRALRSQSKSGFDVIVPAPDETATSQNSVQEKVANVELKEHK